MQVTSQDCFEDHEVVETLGIVMGNTVRTRHIGSDILAGLRNIVGGEASGYTQLMTEAREEALFRLKEEADAKGGNAVVCLRFTTSNVMQGMIEILAYGTAVKVK